MRFLYNHTFSSGPYRADGAAHFYDMIFVFQDIDTVNLQPTDAERALGQEVIHYWTSFAETGNPNYVGSLAWSRWDMSDPYLVLDTPLSTGASFDGALCDFWDGVL